MRKRAHVQHFSARGKFVYFFPDEANLFAE